MTEVKIPADWAIQKALVLRSAENGTKSTDVETVKQLPNIHTMVLAAARYIEAHEEPPVAPELIAARNLLAAVFTHGLNKTEVLAGGCDHFRQIKTFLAGVEWARTNK